MLWCQPPKESTQEDMQNMNTHTDTNTCTHTSGLRRGLTQIFSSHITVSTTQRRDTNDSEEHDSDTSKSNSGTFFKENDSDSDMSHLETSHLENDSDSDGMHSDFPQPLRDWTVHVTGRNHAAAVGNMIAKVC